MDINRELNVRQKYIVLIRLAEFIYSSGHAVSATAQSLIETVVSVFKIPENDFKICVQVAKKDRSVPDDESYLIIDSQAETTQRFTHHLRSENMNGYILVAHLKKVSTVLLRYTGDSELTLNGQPVKNDFVYLFTPGSVIRGGKVESIYYSDVIHRFVSGGK